MKYVIKLIKNENQFMQDVPVDHFVFIHTPDPEECFVGFTSFGYVKHVHKAQFFETYTEAKEAILEYGEIGFTFQILEIDFVVSNRFEPIKRQKT